MLGIICAMESEAQAVLDSFDISSTFTAFGKKFYTGEIMTQKAVLAVSGIGKVNAAMTTQYLFDTYKEVDTLLNIGVCGGVKGKVELGKIYLVTKAAQYDLDTTEIDDVPHGFIYGLETEFVTLKNPFAKHLLQLFSEATLATGDRFTSSADIDIFIEKHFGAELREMEGGAIAQVCAFHNKNCIMLKGVSDFVGAESVNMYEKYCQQALDAFSVSMPAIMNALNK
ncbi:MAG TPA: 5'-methylthioadenosine/S-adenosylhomocysteine nucleosidase [Clostridia bacterium]|nr:5'-methylthioadenosine/S-adenosylhomocysteine nucleosidase [Clostridia bacterium]